MDLTLEINGWVESLEDALTQFTTPEDLDGENMYRCGRFVELAFLCCTPYIGSHNLGGSVYTLFLNISYSCKKVCFICSSTEAVEYTRGAKYLDNCPKEVSGILP